MMSDRAVLLEQLKQAIRLRRSGLPVTAGALNDDTASFSATLAAAPMNPQYAAFYMKQAAEALRGATGPLLASGHSAPAIAQVVKTILSHYPKGIQQAIYGQYGLSAHTANPNQLATK